VKDVALGENGIIEGAKPGTVLIDMSSIARWRAVKLAMR
jgi:2-hydroxy-3-oxopropionate reductase